MFPMYREDVAVITVKFIPCFSHMAIYFRHNTTISCFFVSLHLTSADSVEYWQLAVLFRIQIGNEDVNGRFA